MRRLERGLATDPTAFGELHDTLRGARLRVGVCFAFPIGYEYGVHLDELVVFVSRACRLGPP